MTIEAKWGQVDEVGSIGLASGALESTAIHTSTNQAIESGALGIDVINIPANQGGNPNEG